jgi:hypothetical protein
MTTKTLDRKLSRFARRFGVSSVSYREHWVYNPANNTISYDIWSCPQDDEKHIEFLNQRYNTDISPWYFIFSFLHEVGHRVTLPTLSNSQEWFEIGSRLELLPLIKDDNLRDQLYWRLPAEDMANKWAISYILENQKKCWKFQRKCGKILNKIYKSLPTE